MMSKWEVLNSLKVIGVSMSPKTLLNYEIWGLILPPKRTRLGRGRGTLVEYPDSVVIDVYAIYKTLHGKAMKATVPALILAKRCAEFHPTVRALWMENIKEAKKKVEEYR